jgi:hypothetical protein
MCSFFIKKKFFGQWNTFICNRGTTWLHRKKIKIFFLIETVKAKNTLIFVRENAGALLKSI